MSIKATARNGVASIEIARPEKKNALTPAMYTAMSDALDAATEGQDRARGALHRAARHPHVGQRPRGLDAAWPRGWRRSSARSDVCPDVYQNEDQTGEHRASVSPGAQTCPV
jgi:hypothetical protein